MRNIEIGVGVLSGLLLFLYWQGTNVLPVLLILALIAAVIHTNRARYGGKSFAVAAEKKTREDYLGFEDIGGQDVAKNELREALEFVRSADSIKRLGIRPLKGILLNGPPGTGKTLLAKAAAHFTNSVFVAASGSEFVEMYVGVGAQRVRQLFKQAKDLAAQHQKDSAVVFIDEIEVLGGKRGQASSHLEYDQTLNELLVQMDGLSFDDQVRVLVIGATNRADMLDDALLRPGRFDRQVKVDLPDKKGRLHILQLHTRNKPLAENADLEEIAAETFGFSGAHLESVTNEAAILALRDQAMEITLAHLRSAVEKVMMGEKLDRIPNPEEKRRIAIHEAGHAVLGEVVQPGSVASINIASRGRALGYVRQTQQDDLYLYTFDYLKGRMAVAMAGALAEEMMLGNRSTGAASDFSHVADIAKQIIFGGMSHLGIVSRDDLPKEILYKTISEIVREMEAYVHDVLQLHKEVLNQTVHTLLTKESVPGTEFRTLFSSAVGGQ